MPRQGRINIKGGIYHVIQRGIERKAVFRDNADRGEFIRRLGEGLKETGHKCYGWVLMPNHFHLLIRTGVRPLSDLMRKLLTGYALYFNKKYKRIGYLYQNRYKSILCQEETYLLELLRYIHLNPLRSKMVEGIKELNRYKWSGHSVLAGKNKAEWQSTGEILERFGKNRAEAVNKYIKFVAEAKDLERREEFSGGGLLRSAGGWVGVSAIRKAHERWAGDERILGDGDFVDKTLKQADEQIIKREKLKKEGWDINKVVTRTCELLGIDEKDIRLRSKGTKIAQARSLIAYFGNRELGVAGVELARYFGITKSSISSAIRRGSKIAYEYKYHII